MTLRARLLLGAALIALVLGVAAVAIVRTTRSNLVDQLDAQLQSANERFGEGFGPNGPGESPGSPQGAPPALSSLYVGRISADGELLTLRLPNLQGDDAPVPELDAGDRRALQAGRAITVGSSDPDIDYRMRAQRE